MTIRNDYFLFVAKLVESEAGIVLEEDKKYLVELRLQHLARKHALKSVDDLIGELRSKPGASQAAQTLRTDIVENLTTNETYFFRDGHPFDALRNQVLPDLINARAGERKIRIWSAACSTGQEPYSIAMLWQEYFPECRGWDFKVLATDICMRVLRRAELGVYTKTEAERGLPPEFLKKYFRFDDVDWRIVESVRRMVEFRAMNLIGPWPDMPAPDIIFMRNVLIYFNSETKQGLLARAAKFLRPGGYVFLGGAENPLSLHAGLAQTAHRNAGCYRIKPALK